MQSVVLVYQAQQAKHKTHHLTAQHSEPISIFSNFILQGVFLNKQVQLATQPKSSSPIFPSPQFIPIDITENVICSNSTAASTEASHSTLFNYERLTKRQCIPPTPDDPQPLKKKQQKNQSISEANEPT